MRRTVSYLLAASIAASGSAVGFTGANAAMPRLSVPASVEAGAQVEQVDHKRYKKRYKKYRKYSRKRRYDRDYSYYRHRDRRYRYRHRHSDGAALAAGIIGFTLGAAIANSYSAPRYSGGMDYDYCARKYRSWDPYSKTYLGYDGRRHYCRIP